MADFSRKHYEQVAEILRIHRGRYQKGTTGRAIVAEIALEFADMFERDNPRFDRGRFLRATEPREKTELQHFAETKKGQHLLANAAATFDPTDNPGRLAKYARGRG